MVSNTIPVVIDTNVLVAGLYSRQGASYQVLRLLIQQKIVPLLSVPLLLEYEAVLYRRQDWLGLSKEQVETVLNALARLAQPVEIFYLWRPWLPDPKDDMLLELAVAGKAQAIVTHNVKDFRDVDRFGIEVLSPQQLLRRMERKTWEH